MHRALLVFRLVIAERRILLQRLPDARNATVAENAKAAGEEWLPPAVAFNVVDTGVGISEEDVQRLFQAFVQVGEGLQRSDGTGLGLHLSHKLAELMGGELTAASEPGRGSRFTLTLAQPV